VSDLTSDLASLRIQRDEDPNRPRPARTAALIAVALAGLGAAAYVAYPTVEGRLFKTEVAMTEITLVSPAQAAVTVTSTGYVVPQTVSRVGAKVPGRVARVFVKEGSVVKAGEILAELEATDQKSSIAAAGSRAAAARARIETARANLAETEQQVARERALFQGGAISKASVDDLEARARSLQQSLKATEAEARAAEADVTPLRVSLRDRTITSPIEGTVISKPIEAGELVGVQSNNIAEIVDFRSLLIETDVPEARLYQIKVGSPCEIALDAYPGKRYRGVTYELGKKVDRTKATVIVKVKFVDPMEGVLPNMSARTSFLSEEVSADAIKEKPKRVIPANAIAERDGKKVVFAVQEGVVKVTPVQVGGAFGSGFELVDGPQPGTRVVANPPPQLSDGQHIKEKGG